MGLDCVRCVLHPHSLCRVSKLAVGSPEKAQTAFPKRDAKLWDAARAVVGGDQRAGGAMRGAPLPKAAWMHVAFAVELEMSRNGAITAQLLKHLAHTTSCRETGVLLPGRQQQHETSFSSSMAVHKMLPLNTCKLP